MEGGFNMAVSEQTQHSIKRESKVCELAIRRLREKCKVFEEKHQMDSDDFLTLFQEGTIGDEADYFEWKALMEGIREWRKTKEELARLVGC